jgi:hypothetical protein
MWLRRRQRRYCKDNSKPGVREVGCEMVGNGLELCLMAGWGVKTSGFDVRYLYFYVEEINSHSYVTLKRTVLPPKHMAYFQKVSVIMHDDLQRESHHLPCIAKNLRRFSFVAMLR